MTTLCRILLTTTLFFTSCAKHIDVQVHSDGAISNHELSVSDLQTILKNAGRNIKLAERMLQDFDTDHSGGLSELEFLQFKSKRKSPDRFHYNFNLKSTPTATATTTTTTTTKTTKRTGSPTKGRPKKTNQHHQRPPKRLPVHKFSASVVQQQFSAAQQKMQQSVEYLQQTKMMQFMRTATNAVTQATRIIESLPLDQLIITSDVSFHDHTHTLPEWVLQMYIMASKFLHILADQTGNRQYLHQAIPYQNIILKHTSTSSDIYLEALVEASQIQVETAHFCAGIELLQEYSTLRQERSLVAVGEDSYRSALQSLPERSMQQFTLGAHNCDAQLSLTLFGHLVDMGYLDPTQPSNCIKCWGIYGIVLRGLNQHDQVNQFFINRTFIFSFSLFLFFSFSLFLFFSFPCILYFVGWYQNPIFGS
jgi:hypothetical protein